MLAKNNPEVKATQKHAHRQQSGFFLAVVVMLGLQLTIAHPSLRRLKHHRGWQGWWGWQGEIIQEGRGMIKNGIEIAGKRGVKTRVGKPGGQTKEGRRFGVRRHTNPETRAEPQQIVAQRLLSCLQYLVP